MSLLLPGLSGSNPRDFLAALGLLRIVSPLRPDARLHFVDDGHYSPAVDGCSLPELVALVVADAAHQSGPQPWRLEYDKQEKRGVKKVADLKAPPDVFRSFLDKSVSAWKDGQREGAAFAACYATDVAVDGKGNTKPTAFHFTAANQQFLDTVEKCRVAIDSDWCETALTRESALRSGPNLRWDPGADRVYALMADNPIRGGTTVNAPLEWLAFRALPLFPVVPRGTRAETTGVRGRSSRMRFTWPLWSPSASLSTAASLIRLDWWNPPGDSHARGVIAICTSEIRRSSQGFGNFGPANVGF